MTKQRERPADGRRYPLWPLSLLLILTVVSVLLHAAKFRRGKDVLKLRKQYSELVLAQPINEVKAQRARFYQVQYYLGYPTAVSYASADLIRRIDGIITSLRLLHVQLVPGLHDLAFKLSLGVAAAGPEAAQRKFTLFFEKLRDFPGVTQAEFSPPRRSAAGSGLYVFSLSGRAEWQ